MHRQYLIRRIAWRLQANAEGGLSERAIRRAKELGRQRRRSPHADANHARSGAGFRVRGSVFRTCGRTCEYSTDSGPTPDSVRRSSAAVPSRST
ncbi:MAG: DUF2924 domain-containing protein [Planctomycetes bacterium]|nr:DUF2924 domain-containing protein [Planctomycetota bacterium]